MVTIPMLSLTTAIASSFPSSLELFVSTIELRSTGRELLGLDLDLAALLGFAVLNLHVCGPTQVSN